MTLRAAILFLFYPLFQISPQLPSPLGHEARLSLFFIFDFILFIHIKEYQCKRCLMLIPGFIAQRKLETLNKDLLSFLLDIYNNKSRTNLSDLFPSNPFQNSQRSNRHFILFKFLKSLITL